MHTEKRLRLSGAENIGREIESLPENAVRIQISTAIISYCLVAIVQHDMQLERSTYEVLQILSISLTDKTCLKELFEKTNFNDVKELNSSLFPGLFD